MGSTPSPTCPPYNYGASNFQFGKAGGGVCIEACISDYFHSIVDKANAMIRDKRATIVFFPDTARLDEFKRSAFFGKIPRKSLLTEDLDKEDKDYVIKKAATMAQVTLSTAVFGRGTDFVCMDENLLKNGGMHIIQAFLSAEKSEEIQIQGRTARQGKKGSYQMVLLETDLEAFGVQQGDCAKVASSDKYDALEQLSSSSVLQRPVFQSRGEPRNCYAPRWNHPTSTWTSC